MARPASKHPTELELEILKALWRRGGGGSSRPATGREVQEALAASAGRDLAYTSVVTVLNIMTRKGYLRRKKAAEGGGFAYQPSVTERATAGRMLRDLIDRVFHGSGNAVLLKLIEETRLDAGQIAKLRELVDQKASQQQAKDAKDVKERP